MAKNLKMALRWSLEVLPKNLKFNTWRSSGILPDLCPKAGNFKFFKRLRNS